MPVLREYVDKSGSYVLTGVKGNVITYQLTANGLKTLLGQGINPGQRFSRLLLLVLIRSGDAYTGGSGLSLDASGAILGQLELDFSNDPDPETRVPVCAACSSNNDLHFVELVGEKHCGSILCLPCRLQRATEIDTSIPLSLATRPVLNKILSMKNIEVNDGSVLEYQRLLNMEFEQRWKELVQKKDAVQESLFEPDDDRLV